MSTTTEVTYVNANGDPVNLAQIASKHKPQARQSTSLKRVESRADAKESDGFAVTGFSPEHLARAKADLEATITELRRQNEVCKDEPGYSPKRIPPDWDEDAYMRTATPKRARSKPYEIESAADACAALMRKAGWKCVRVDELLKG